MKLVCFLTLLLISFFVFGQRHSETVKDKDIYGADTQWSCIDKHFGYYYLNYSKPMAFSPGLENELLSGRFIAGYTYRYKIIDIIDAGAELAYSNRRSVLVEDSVQKFDPGTFYNSVFTYHNYISASLYLRLDFAGSSYRNLGIFTDFGCFYSYSFNYGIQYNLKTKDLNQKARFKKPYYLFPDEYGLFMRAGYNNIAIIFSYSFGEWVSGFSNENSNYSRSPFMAGIQLNLYSK